MVRIIGSPGHFLLAGFREGTAFQSQAERRQATWVSFAALQETRSAPSFCLDASRSTFGAL